MESVQIDHQDLFSNLLENHAMFSDLNNRIVDEFLLFHREQPRVYRLFEHFAYEALNAGQRHYGSKAIFERIRWHMEVERKEEFKVNNNYASGYARLLMIQNKAFDGFFELRHTPIPLKGMTEWRG